jgi:hypothetical protein
MGLSGSDVLDVFDGFDVLDGSDLFDGLDAGRLLLAWGVFKTPSRAVARRWYSRWLVRCLAASMYDFAARRVYTSPKLADAIA